jgi:glycosyltransferase involved in cell wall biosynthesis
VHSVGALIGVVASEWAGRLALPHVCQIVGSDVNSHLAKSYRSPFVRGWEKHLHAVACNSSALKKAFLDLYPGTANAETIYRGVDLRAFVPDGEVAGPLVGKPAPRFLFLGGYEANHNLPFGYNTKGGDTLMRAWAVAELDLASSGASLLFAGPGADSEIVRRWRLGLRRPGNVFIGPQLEPAAVADHLRSCDAVLIPSMQEGLPNLAMEAAACGRAVIGSNVGGIPEALRHETTGLILPPGDTGAWANALIRVCQCPAWIAQLGAAGRRFMEAKFDSFSYAPKMLALYTRARACATGESDGGGG